MALREYQRVHSDRFASVSRAADHVLSMRRPYAVDLLV